MLDLPSQIKVKLLAGNKNSISVFGTYQFLILKVHINPDYCNNRYYNPVHHQYWLCLCDAERADCVRFTGFRWVQAAGILKPKLHASWLRHHHVFTYSHVDMFLASFYGLLTNKTLCVLPFGNLKKITRVSVSLMKCFWQEAVKNILRVIYFKIQK